LCEGVRQGGILSLEDYPVDSTFLKTAIMLIVDGVHELEVKQIMQNWIISGNYRGRMLLKRILIMEGVIAIQQGSNPDYVYDLLASYFGEDFYPKYIEYCNDNGIAPNGTK
jgi:flagellar motor component MotA